MDGHGCPYGRVRARKLQKHSALILLIYNIFSLRLCASVFISYICRPKKDEFCAFLEQAESKSRRRFVDTALKLLPLLYLKASMLPPCEAEGMAEPEIIVTESDYDAIRSMVAGVLADRDDYLDVFLADMRYSDTPIRRNISEDLADIYQDIKNFVGVYRLGFDETMHDALAICEEHFASYWGQVLVNTMRALHEVKYGFSAEDGADDEAEEELDELQ